MTTDTEILTYIKNRVEETTERSPEASDFRDRMLTPLVVLLREEGGLSWNDISEELGISKYAAMKSYESAGGDTS